MLHKLAEFLGFAQVDENEDSGDSVRREENYSEENNTNNYQSTKKGKVISMASSTIHEVYIIHPASFEDSPEIVMHLQVRQSVAVNLESLEQEVARRIIDFLSGAVVALDAKMEKVTRGVFMLVPSNIGLTNEIKAEIKSKAFFPFMNN